MTTPPDGAFAAALRRRDRAAVEAIVGSAVLPRPTLVPRPWGGQAIARHRGQPDVPVAIGESFELAAAASDPEAATYATHVRLPDGDAMALGEVLHACPELLGEAHVLAFGHELPLLPKLLDVQSLLSIQAYPPGHPELYVVIDAAPGATLHLGLQHDTDARVLAARLGRGVELQREVADFLHARSDAAALTDRLSSWLLGDPSAPLDLELARLCSPIAGSLMALQQLGAEVLGRMHEIAVGPGTVIHNCVPHPTQGHPSATLHALGNPGRLPVLALEIRLVGPTFRAWDHGRLPARALDIAAALAHAPMTAQRVEDFVLATDDREFAIDNGVFTAERLALGTAAVQRRGRERPEFVHVCSGVAELGGGRNPLLLHAGDSALVPASWPAWSLRSSSTASVVIASLCPRSTALAARTRTLQRVREIVGDSAGPREVIAIANAGDGPLVSARFEAARTQLFRRDGATRIVVHEEPVRRGQLLGMIDAVRQWSPATKDDVALGIMLPGQGTRLSPITQRLHGIKSFVPMPIRSERGGAWMTAGEASLHSWVLVAHALRERGFSGIAWKWGDEPQLPSSPLDDLPTDLRGVDAVRFGKRAEITEELARSKEWLLCAPDGRLVAQVRRRSAGALRERLANAGPATRSLIHIGSPALSHRFIRALVAEFGDVGGWLDIDGYLFEALTHGPPAWQRECERDAGLQALLAVCPDFYERATAVKSRLEAERGAPLVTLVVDCGNETWWGDMGQLGPAREAFARLAVPGAEGEFARRLALIADVVPDRFGNRIVSSRIPEDGSVRDSVVINGWIGAGSSVTGAVVLDSVLGAATLGHGAVVVDSTIDTLDAGVDTWVFRAIAEQLSVAAYAVHTTLPSDPLTAAGGGATAGLEQWSFDARADPSAPPHWTEPQGANPTSLHDKAAQMRQRERPIDVVEAEIETNYRTPLAARIRAQH